MRPGVADEILLREPPPQLGPVVWDVDRVDLDVEGRGDDRSSIWSIGGDSLNLGSDPGLAWRNDDLMPPSTARLHEFATIGGDE